MATATISAEQRFRLSGISWKAYVAFTDLLESRNVRVTYDRGEMEVRTLSPQHERCKKRLARLIHVLTEELDIAIACYGSMTCRREDRERGFEPDECYWIAHAEVMRNRDEIDFTCDPPPDLAIEVEISRSSIPRLPLYASLGVPELWRWDGEQLRVSLLGEDGQYHESARSQALPFLPCAELVRFLKMRDISETRVVRAFREWVREQQTHGWEGTKRRTNGGKGQSKPRRRPQ